ncbi:DCC1-like thiol-disulfide oxidoreductase family protein [Polaribacter sp.]|nr:DCC1-like thiol-disulfide oxidoreductase family protein [Polaribacter sp.]MDC0086262.1 DCC1-like thiol-disulfide oxidoreductase family protein [Polaribacter sp.]
MTHLPKNKKIILFDGMCNLCNNSVLKVIRFVTKNNFVFCALQSEIGQEIIHDLKIDRLKMDSIILYESPNNYTYKSTAVLKIMNTFGGWWNLTQICWIVPPFLRNLIYDFIARNRYKWFGKKDHCMCPTPALEKRFLTSFTITESTL